MAKSKYDVMSPSDTVTDNNGSFYPDISTFPINKFSPSVKYLNYSLTYGDIYRFDQLINGLFGSFDFYDDFSLWISDVAFLSLDSNFEAPMKFYTKSDIDNWYSKNLK